MFSKAILCFILYGCHTAMAQCKWDLTIVLYSGKNVSLSRNWKVLLIILVIFIALFTTWLICSSNVSLESKVAPRSFCLSRVYGCCCYCRIIFIFT